MSYTHRIIERSKLEALHQLGLSARAIARELDRHHSTRPGTQEKSKPKWLSSGKIRASLSASSPSSET